MSDAIIKFRCASGFKKAVEEIADDEHRSTSNYIKSLILEDMKKREEEKGKV